MLTTIKELRHSNMQFYDSYYKVSWTINRTELLVEFGLLLFMNLFCICNIIFRITNADPFLYFAWICMNLCSIPILYVALKFPCVRWRLDRVKETEPDITEKQTKYRKRLCIVYHGALLAWGLYVLYIQFFVTLME